MALGDYNPTTAETNALFLYLLTGCFGGVTLAVASIGFGCKLWYKNHGVRPIGFNPYVVTFFYTAMGLLAGAAFWEGWSEVYRLEVGLPNVSGGIPSNMHWHSTWITVLCHMLLYALQPLTFWIGGVDLKMFGAALCGQFLVMGSAVTATVLLWMMYWLAGLLFLFPAVFSIYIMYIHWYFWSVSGQNDAIFTVPIQYVAGKACPGYALPPTPVPLVHQQVPMVYSTGPYQQP